MSDLVQAILAGQYDDELSEVLEAIRRREKEEAVQILWRIDFQGLEVTAENLTVAEARTIETVCRTSIHNFTPAASATNASTVIMAALMHRNGLTSEEAMKEVGKHTARSLLDAVTPYTVVSPPKDGSEPPSSES